MAQKASLNPVHGFVIAVLLGACSFGVTFASLGAWDAWKEPVIQSGKEAGTERTVLGNAAEGFWAGVQCGAILGGAAGIGIFVMRTCSRKQIDQIGVSHRSLEQVVFTHKTTTPNLTWLVGRQLKAVEKIDYSWFFTFDDGSSIATESFWRLVTGSRVAVTSEDHGHQFGLPAPVDAVELAKTKIGDRTAEQFNLDERTGDLSLHFGDKILQFVTTSAGYEGWRIVHGSQEVICGGGGRLLEPTE